MDLHTAEHLEHWLHDNFHEEDHQNIRVRMVTLFNEDPQYWGDKGWWRVYSASE